MSTYKKATKKIAEFAAPVIEQFHAHLIDTVKIDYVLAFGDPQKTGGHSPAIKHGGYPALGVCRIVNLKDRAKGNGDVEITLDADWLDDPATTDAQKLALLDHELHHIQLRYDGDGALITDDLNRPKIKMRKHDRQFGWFDAVAARQGKASQELIQARAFYETGGELYFSFVSDLKGEIKDKVREQSSQLKG